MAAVCLLATTVAAAQVSPAAAPKAPAASRAHHFPSVVTYQSLNVVAPPETEADWRFEIEHLDRAMGRAHALGIKKRAPDFYYFRYRLLETTDQGSEEKEVEKFCSARGMEPEDAYLHYVDDTTASAAGKTWTVPGWGKGSAKNRREARMRTFLWDTWRWVWDWNSRCAREYLKARSEADLRESAEGVHLYDGLFIDEMGMTYAENGGGSLMPPASKGGHIAEFEGRSKQEVIASRDYQKAIDRLFEEISQHLKQVSGGRSLVLANTGTYSERSTTDLGLHADGLFTEYISEIASPSGARGEANIWDIAKKLAEAGKVYVINESSAKPPRRPDFAACNYPSASARQRMYSLASYWMAKQGDLTWFNQVVPGWVQLREFWLKAQERDLGAPAGDYYEWQKGVDAAGQNFRIWRRDYARAIVLFRTRVSWEDRDFANFGAPTPAFPLGGNYSVLYPDGSLGPAISQIGVCLGEGVVLAPQQ